MRKKIYAFYDVFVFAIISVALLIMSSIIFVKSGYFGDFDWIKENWYYIFMFAFGIMIPIGGTFFLRYFEISENDYACFNYLSSLSDWSKSGKSIDTRWNKQFNPSEISNMEIISLSKSECQKFTSKKYMINKFLKINLRFGKSKYINVGTYSKSQLKIILNLLGYRK